MHEDHDNTSDEHGARSRAGALADLGEGGLDPLPQSVTESLLSLIADSRSGGPVGGSGRSDEDGQAGEVDAAGESGGSGGGQKAGSAEAVTAEPLAAHAADGADAFAEEDPQLTASAYYETVPIDGDDDPRCAAPLEPVPASISGLLARACADIESELIEHGSMPQGLDGFDHVLMTSVGRMPNVRHAHGVETVVELERGRWTVDVVVIFPDGLVRHRIDTFHTRARAETSARLIKRTAERELQGPFDA